jgi:cytochrome c
MRAPARILRHAAAGACALAFLVLSGTAVLAADAEHGKALFGACAACHSERPDALGPSLKGVVGRKSAALEDFRYSSAMKRAQLIWDEDNLRAYLKDPQAKVKGNRMPYSGLADASDVEDLIAYLKALK